MKWGFPLTFTVFQLAWNILEFKEAFELVGEFEEAMDSVKWGSDYLINAHPSPFVFYGQLGDSKIDFRYFGPPEEYEFWSLGPKPVYAVCFFYFFILFFYIYFFYFFFIFFYFLFYFILFFILIFFIFYFLLLFLISNNKKLNNILFYFLFYFYFLF